MMTSLFFLVLVFVDSELRALNIQGSEGNADGITATAGLLSS